MRVSQSLGCVSLTTRVSQSLGCVSLSDAAAHRPDFDEQLHGRGGAGVGRLVRVGDTGCADARGLLKLRADVGRAARVVHALNTTRCVAGRLCCLSVEGRCTVGFWFQVPHVRSATSRHTRRTDSPPRRLLRTHTRGARWRRAAGLSWSGHDQ